MLYQKIFVCSLLIGLSWQTSCPPSYTFESTLDSCIGVASSERLTMEANEQICAGYGGHVVKINNNFENMIFQAHFQRLLPGLAAVQLGIKKNGSTWKWNDGSTPNFTYFGSTSYPGNCAYMNIQSGSTPYWYPYPCEQKFMTVCRVPVQPCPTGWTLFAKTGKCYYYGRNATVDQATQYCTSKGGQLASIHSADENNFVQDLIATDKCSSAYYSNNFYESNVILGGISTSGSVQTWWDGSTFDYQPTGFCRRTTTYPIIYMDGRPVFCRGCGGVDGNSWQTPYYNITSTFVYPGYVCKAPPPPTIKKSA